MALYAEEPVVNPSTPIPRRLPIFYEILAYFADHPGAQDTVEGIVEWWLLEQRLKRAIRQVKATLAQLVAEGLVVERERPVGRVMYRVNRSKMRDIHSILKKKRIKGSIVNFSL